MWVFKNDLINLIPHNLNTFAYILSTSLLHKNIDVNISYDSPITVRRNYVNIDHFYLEP